MRNVLQKLLAEIEMEYTVRGSFLTGSYARNKQLKTSDVDVFIIIDGSWRQRVVRFIEGYEFELFFNPAWKLDQELNEASLNGDSSTVSILHDAEILSDPYFEVARLKAHALKIEKEGPPLWDELQRELVRSSITDLVKDIDDIRSVGNLNNFNLLIGIAMDKIIEAYFGLRRIWLPKHKYRLEEYLKLEPNNVLWVETILNGDIANLYQLAEQSLKPVGGLLHGDWSLQPEQLTRDLDNEY
jgi:predicted nucleotidyltransferase